LEAQINRLIFPTAWDFESASFSFPFLPGSRTGIKDELKIRKRKQKLPSICYEKLLF